jgi:hypothetical protein
VGFRIIERECLLIFDRKGYGESALFLGILGDPKDGKIPLEYLKVLFGKKLHSAIF